MRRLSIVAFACVAFAAASFAGFALAGIGVVATRAQLTSAVTVHVREWSFDLSQETVPVGTVVFTVVNDGPAEPHDFAVGGRTSAVLRPGESTTLTVTFTQPGLYSYEDTVADTDREMYGTLSVSGAAVSTSSSSATVTTRATTDPPLPLAHVADVALPGSATRFDYQSVDVARRRLFVAHLGAGRVVFFDLARRRVSGTIGGIAGAHGVLVVPSLVRLYVAATGTRQLVTLDERTGRVIARAPAGTYPDGVAYDPRDRLVFVSDEAGDQVTVFAASGRRLAAVKLGGDAGNVQYDGPSGHVLVAIGSKNTVALIDPRKRKIVGTIALPGCDHAHGLHLDSAHRLAFVACDNNATLLVVDLRTMKVTDTESVGDRPDVLDLDAGLGRLYVASESGEVSVFLERGRAVAKLGQAKLADNAHTVAVDPRTHFVYFPLENLNGRPVLRIMRPT